MPNRGNTFATTPRSTAAVRAEKIPQQRQTRPRERVLRRYTCRARPSVRKRLRFKWVFFSFSSFSSSFWTVVGSRRGEPKRAFNLTWWLVQMRARGWRKERTGPSELEAVKQEGGSREKKTAESWKCGSFFFLQSCFFRIWFQKLSR